MQNESDRAEQIRALIPRVAPEVTAIVYRAHDAVEAAELAAQHAERAVDAIRAVVGGHYAERGDETPGETLDAALAWLEHSANSGG